MSRVPEYQIFAPHYLISVWRADQLLGHPSQCIAYVHNPKRDRTAYSQPIRLHVPNLLALRHLTWHVTTTAPITLLPLNHILSILRLNFLGLPLSPMHEVLQIDLRPLEPLPRVDKPPDTDQKLHQTSVSDSLLRHRQRQNSSNKKRIRTIGPPQTRHVQLKSAGVKSSPTLHGKHKIGIMSTTNALATLPITRLYRPRCQGPARKRFPTKKTRMKIGVVKAKKAASAPMEKMASIAAPPAKMRRRTRQPMAVLNQTALTGVLVFWLTCFQMRERGKQSSRA